MAFTEAEDLGLRTRPMIIGGLYGLSGWEFEPRHVIAVLANLNKTQPKRRFIIGPNDDLGFTSLEIPKNVPVTLPQGTTECIFWAAGGDGAIGSNKSACDIIGQHTEMYCQAYFQFSAKKSHLRFGPSPINATYDCTSANYLAIHRVALCHSFPLILKPLKNGGKLVFNAPWSSNEEVESYLPPHYLRQIAEKKVKLYCIDATTVAEKVGLPGKVNNILQSVFFKLSEVLPIDLALQLLKDSVVRTYSKKGDEVVQMNITAIDQSLEYLTEISVPKHWSELPEYSPVTIPEAPEIYNEVILPATQQRGHDIPVSKVVPLISGKFPIDTSKYDRRRVALKIPEWSQGNCISCNACVVACPTQAIRVFVVDEEQKQQVPETFSTIPLKGKKGLEMRIQVAPNDCLGCTICASSCPRDALSMKDTNTVAPNEEANWDYAFEHLKNEDHGLGNSKNYKDLGYKDPLMLSPSNCFNGNRY
ncbi:hypothetical protein RCL1_008343 [Eukaryota sp. TZLM3-RCL]